MESRGFIFGAAVADRLGTGFMPVRKPGKLPSKTVKVSYDLEYGTDSLEMHCDAVEEGHARADRRRPAGDRRHGQGDRLAAARAAARTWSACRS